MSGIAGVLDPHEDERVSREHVQAMLRALWHRCAGPTATYASGPTVLGQCSAAPCGALAESGDGPVVAVLDGEIRNAAELRDRLGAAGREEGARFPAGLVARLYRRYGSALPALIEGPFALAVYDARERVLFLARDHAGSRPLHFARIGGGFYFSSEIKAFWTIIRPSLSDAGLLTYFAFTQAPAPFTLFEGVRKLVPAHHLSIAVGGEPRVQPYWRLHYAPKVRGSLREAAGALDEQLTSALARGLRGTGPEGVALSGGVDSSVIVGLKSRLVPDRFPTFTIGSSLRDGSVDPEFVRAQAVAARYGTDHHAWELGTLTFDDFRRALRVYDEPIGIFDSVHYLRLFALAKEHATSVVTGNGADSLFTGSASYGSFRRRTLARQVALRLSRDPRRAIGEYLLRRLRRTHLHGAAALLSPPVAHSASEGAVSSGALACYLDLFDADEVLDAHQFLELYLRQCHLLTIDDAVGAASSVRVRSPFLDRRVMEFAAALPTRHKVGLVRTGTRNKLALRELALRYMPRDLVYAEKLNCGNFIDYEGMIRGSWQAEVEALWLERGQRLGDVFAKGALPTLWQRFLGGRLTVQDRYTFRKVMIFLVWHEQVFERIANPHGAGYVAPTG